MNKEVYKLSKAIMELIEGGDYDTDSVQEAFKIMKKYKLIDPVSEEFLYQED